MTPNQTNRCKKHGVIHKNGGYPSCTPHTQQKGWEKEFYSVIKKAGLHLGYKQSGRIEDVKSFIENLLTEQKNAFVEIVEKQEASGIGVDEYLPIVQTGNFDKMFDYAYEKAKSDLLNKLDEI